MTKFEAWFLRRVFKREVLQGPYHKANIENLYGMIRDACENEFTEDNAPTMDLFLLQCFLPTMKSKAATSEFSLSAYAKWQVKTEEPQ